MQNDIKQEEIVNLLLNTLDYAYCDNCGNCDKDSICGYCNRKGQSWKLGENTANYLAKEIIRICGRTL